VLQWTTSYNSHMLSVSPGVFEADGHIVFFDTEDGHTLGTFGPVSKMGGMSGGKVMVYRDEHKEVSVIQLFRHSRLKAISLMQAAWDTHKGKPPTCLNTLSRTLCLRRFCRVRGFDTEDMETELVEPFARDIVRFL